MAAEPSPTEAGDKSGVTSLSLLEQLRANDPAAWQRFAALYAPLVRFWCARSGLRGPDAEDLAQEVFAAAAAGLSGFHRDRPGDTFRGWLRGITRNQVLMHFRRTRRQPQAKGGSAARLDLENLPGPADDDADDAGAVNSLYRRALEYVRGEFTERLWQAFWRTAIDERRPADVAAELGMTPAAVRQAKSRVLRRLKQELGELLA